MQERSILWAEALHEFPPPVDVVRTHEPYHREHRRMYGFSAAIARLPAGSRTAIAQATEPVDDANPLETYGPVEPPAPPDLTRPHRGLSPQRPRKRRTTADAAEPAASCAGWRTATRRRSGVRRSPCRGGARASPRPGSATPGERARCPGRSAGRPRRR